MRETNRIEINAGELCDCRKFSERSHCADQSEDRYKYGRAGTFIKEGKSDTLEKSIHLNADVLGRLQIQRG